jgi:hypothetical protein
VDELPLNETWDAMSFLAQLDWLAGEITAEEHDADALGRQVDAAGVLFTGLDNPAALPGLRRALSETGIDLMALLGWYRLGVPVKPREERLALVDAVREDLRPRVADAIERCAPDAQRELRAAAERHHESLSSFARRAARR